MSAPYDPYSDASGSDSDDAPEEVTLSTAKKGLQEEKKKALEEQRRYVVAIAHDAVGDSRLTRCPRTQARAGEAREGETSQGETGCQGQGQRQGQASRAGTR